jgi:uncharacterized repeat protein (TIGR03843 family)
MFKNSTDSSTLSILSEGKLTLQGEFLWGSNYTYLAKIESGSTVLQGVYKPTRGERPLWDFPTASLARREVAAFLLSEALNWGLVPATVYRKKGPLGPGSLQLFIEHDPEYHYFNFCEADHQRLRPVALFDLLVNNADRKGSHILVGADSRLWLIDHGICFHSEDKLRTVVWDFAGEQIPSNLCEDLTRLRGQLKSQPGLGADLVNCMESFLSQIEIAAVAERIDRLLISSRFPNPDPNRRPYPWPPV